MKQKMQILKTKDGKVLIGRGGPHRDGYRINVPFELRKTDQGVTITPYDVELIDTYIPFIDFEEYEYTVEPEKALAEFYATSSEAFVEQVKERIASGITPEEIEAKNE